MKCIKKWFESKDVGNEQPNRETMEVPMPEIVRPHQDRVIPDFKISSKKEIYPLALLDLDPDRGGFMVPTHVVHHYVVGYKTQSTVDYFKSNGVDIHFVFGHKGEVIQMSELNRQCAHAGESKLGSLSGFNRFSIGIEHVNLGLLKKEGSKFFDYYGRPYNKPDVRMREYKGAKAYWEPLTEAQEQRTLELALYLYLAYGIKPENHVGHYEISGYRGKADPWGSYSWGTMDEVRNQIRLYIEEYKFRQALKKN